jgi:hypothetical protein
MQRKVPRRLFMSSFARKNKFILGTIVAVIVISGLTFSNLPGLDVPTGVITVNGVTFDFSDYLAIDHEQLAIFNYLNTLVSTDYQEYGEWEGWYVDEGPQVIHYHLAFSAYSASFIFETTSGYRTNFYHDFTYDAIKKMNTSEAEYGNNSIEFTEWTSPELYGDPGYVDYWYPDPVAPDADDIYTGGFRGPANIMWTGHYALMMSLYERNFNTGLMTEELQWFMEDWNNSMTTDGFGNPKEGGIWGVGLVPCEPFFVFTQCNSIPIATTELYDSLYGTNYMPIWDFGLNHINNIMRDEYGLTTHGYYIQEPMGLFYDDDVYPGQAISGYDSTKPGFQAYGAAWTMAWLEHTQPTRSANDYPILIDTCMKEVSGDSAYMMSTYNNPDQYWMWEVYATFFTLLMANQQADVTTRNRLVNFLYGSFNKEWSNDGRSLHYNTVSLAGLAQPVLANGWIWAHAPITIEDMLDARPTEFWDYPYISEADDSDIWVYQAKWDPVNDGFVLNLRVDAASTLTFSNFDSLPIAYLVGGQNIPLESAGSGLYSLDLNPGIYQMVIM